jgi:hypothetical protein
VTYLKSPSLVLGPGDRGFVVWSQTTDSGGGCASPDPGPLDGTYVGVDAGGTWTTHRLSKAPGGSSLTLDPSSGRIDVIVGTGSLTHYVSEDGKTWTSKALVGTGGLSNPAIRRNPADGSLGVVAIDWTDSRNGVYVSTQQ